MGMRLKTGRPLNVPTRGGTMHITGRWENRLWMYHEAEKYSLSLAQIFDELIEAQRKGRKYNPQRIVDELSWEDDTVESVAVYDKRKTKNSALLSKVERKIKELDERRST